MKEEITQKERDLLKAIENECRKDNPDYTEIDRLNYELINYINDTNNMDEQTIIRIVEKEKDTLEEIYDMKYKENKNYGEIFKSSAFRYFVSNYADDNISKALMIIDKYKDMYCRGKND